MFGRLVHSSHVLVRQFHSHIVFGKSYHLSSLAYCMFYTRSIHLAASDLFLLNPYIFFFASCSTQVYEFPNLMPSSSSQPLKCSCCILVPTLNAKKTRVINPTPKYPDYYHFSITYSSLLHNHHCSHFLHPSFLVSFVYFYQAPFLVMAVQHYERK